MNFLGVDYWRERSRNRQLNLEAEDWWSFFKNIGKISDPWLFYDSHPYSSF